MVCQRQEEQLVDLQQRYRELATALSQVGFICAGSLTCRFTRCSTAGCRCNGEPSQPHGPYWQWTTKVNGKTVTRRLSAEQAALYQEWIDNDRRLRSLVDEMRQVSATATQLLLERLHEATTRV